jgi:hypothetical protein
MEIALLIKDYSLLVCDALYSGAGLSPFWSMCCLYLQGFFHPEDLHSLRPNHFISHTHLGLHNYPQVRHAMNLASVKRELFNKIRKK